jgi:hypothetical protein
MVAGIANTEMTVDAVTIDGIVADTVSDDTASAEPVAEMLTIVTEEAAVVAEVYDMLKEIENDTPPLETVYAYENIDDAENDILALFKGVIIDDGIFPTADVPEGTHTTAPEGSSTVSAPETVIVNDQKPYVNAVALPDKIPDEAIGIFFSFMSEENPSPSMDVRFVWGH